MTHSEAIRAWLRDYATCLDGASPVIETGDEPAESFLTACQEFDTTLRQFDVGTLRRELATPRGQELMAALDAAKARFEAAIEGRRALLEGRLHDLHRSRTALRGYADAGEHQRMGAVYIEKQI